jgi:hypothetical protein
VAELGRNLYFTGYTTVLGRQLYFYDGTAVSIIESPGIEPYEAPIRFGNSLYLRAFDANSNSYLYRFDGTTIGIVPGSPYAPHEITPLGDKLFLRGSVDGSSDLFTFDGATWQRYPQPGTPQGPGSFVLLGNAVYMEGYNGTRVVMFRLEGGTWTEFDGPNDPSAPQGMVSSGGSLYYFDMSGALGRFDGTAFMRIDPDGVPSGPFSITDFGGLVYFAGSDEVFDRRLMSSDGLSTSVIPGSPLSPMNFKVYNGILYFTALQDDNRVLFRFDGTTISRVETTAVNVESVDVADGALVYGGSDGIDGEYAFWSLRTAERTHGIVDEGLLSPEAATLANTGMAIDSTTGALLACVAAGLLFVRLGSSRPRKAPPSGE